jgi:hypothetical protein
LDLATGQRPIAEAWIRELHAILCRGQGTYTTYDEQGNAHDTELKKGAYKTQNNHVQTRAGIHCYTPAIDTAAEMARLVWNVTSEPYAKLRAFDQAAYMHYAFVAIHPFADGNGRVARALTSIPTYKHYRVPILITLDQRDSYFAALAAADDGRYDDFRIFIRNRIADSIVLLAESVRLAKVGTPEEATVRIARNYETRGGYAHVSVDEGGDGLLVAVYNQLHLKIADDAVRKPGIQWSLAFPETDRPFQMPEYRRTLSTPKRFVQLEGKTGAPAHGRIVVPSDAAADDVYVLECGDAAPDLRLEIPIRDVLPKRSMVVEFRVTMFADRVLTATADALAKAGHATLKKRGYLPGRE